MLYFIESIFSNKIRINSQKNSKIREEAAKGHFELNTRVVVYNIPDENNFGTLIKEVSYSKLTEVDKDYIRLTSKGLDFANTVFEEFL